MSKVQIERNVARLWRVEDVADYLGVSNSWVYKVAAAGGLPVRRIGALLRFDQEAIRAFAAGELAAPGRVAALKHGSAANRRS